MAKGFWTYDGVGEGAAAERTRGLAAVQVRRVRLDNHHAVQRDPTLDAGHEEDRVRDDDLVDYKVVVAHVKHERPVVVRCGAVSRIGSLPRGVVDNCVRFSVEARCTIGLWVNPVPTHERGLVCARVERHLVSCARGAATERGALSECK